MMQHRPWTHPWTGLDTLERGGDSELRLSHEPDTGRQCAAAGARGDAAGPGSRYTKRITPVSSAAATCMSRETPEKCFIEHDVRPPKRSPDGNRDAAAAKRGRRVLRLV